jgi:hypothetical protein
LAYELDLPSSYHIHPVISVVHLEQYFPDEFDRPQRPPPAPLIVDGHKKYVMEKLLRQRGTGRAAEIEIK